MSDLAQIMCLKVGLRQPYQPILFAASHAFQRGVEAIRPHTHLDEHPFTAVLCHDVNLADGALPITLDDTVTSDEQGLFSRVFPSVPALASFRWHSAIT